YWIVNLSAQCIEVYTQPTTVEELTYQQQQNYGQSDQISIAIAQQEIGSLTVSDLLP
ncbi:MAG: Uma2 family endonuclease, partial [Leptolyngbyaceae cyanobacterium RM1_405_57]|nr:Uma2 family endonuclease [Leptolyngbyaceae cyanobacterium RM1_405_57]